MKKINKASIASMKSKEKWLARATPEELTIARKKASIASMRSRAKRIAKMTPEERLAYNQRNNAAGKRSREKKKQLLKNMNDTVVTIDTNIYNTNKVNAS